MNKQQINSLALKVDANKGNIEKSDLIRLCTTAGVDYKGTFDGVKQFTNTTINKLLDLAQANASKKISLEKTVENNIITITGTASEFKSNLDFYSELDKQLNAVKLKDGSLFKSTEQLRAERFDNVASQVMESRRK